MQSDLFVQLNSLIRGLATVKAVQLPVLWTTAFNITQKNALQDLWNVKYSEKWLKLSEDLKS